MSGDATAANVKTNYTSEEIGNEDKIAALKERLSKEHTAHVVNGTNGNSNHYEQSGKMDTTENKINPAIANGINAETDNGTNSKNTEKLPNVSSALQKHTNGSSPKRVPPVKIDSKVIEIDGKLSLPAGMSVTPLGL